MEQRQHLVGKFLLLLCLFGILSSWRKLREICQKFLVGMHLVDPYESALGVFLGRYNVGRKNCRSARSILWNALLANTLLALEKNSSLKSFMEDPDAAVEYFFAGVYKDIEKLSASRPHQRESVVGLYMMRLRDVNKPKERPVFELDAWFCFHSCWTVAVTLCDRNSFCCSVIRQMFAVDEWFRMGLSCICGILAVKMLSHVIWDNRHALLEALACAKLRVTLRGLSNKSLHAVSIFSEFMSHAMSVFTQIVGGLRERLRHVRSRGVEVVANVALRVQSSVATLLENWVHFKQMVEEGVDELRLFGGAEIAGDCSEEMCVSEAWDSQSKDCDTMTTVTDSMVSEEHEEECSGKPLEGGVSREWRVVVNGTLYVGHSPSKRNRISHLMEVRDSSVVCQFESTKDRNRRLLEEHRGNQLRRMRGKKPRRPRKRHCEHAVKVQTRNEEEHSPDVARHGVEFAHSLAAIEPDEEDIDGSDRRRQIYSVVRRRRRDVRRARFLRREGVLNVKKDKSPAGTVVRILATVQLLQKKIIRLYSCSAFRHAKFRSNKRFKPGD